MSNKKILKWIIVITIIIIILLITLLLINNSENNNELKSNWIDTTVNNDGIYPEAEDLKYEELEKVTNADDFATVYEYIKNYITYSQDNEEIKVNDLTDTQYKENNNINIKQFENIQKFIVDSAYYENEKLTITRYYVFGVNKEYINNEFTYINMAFIVRCDYDNMTFSVIPINNITEDNIQEIRTQYKYIVNDISENENNSLKFSKMNEDDLIDIYMDKYIYNCLNNSEETYNNLLNEEYRNKRFKNLEEYTNYIQINKEKIENFVDIVHQKNETEEYCKYIIQDNYNNHYVIIEKGLLDYTIMLDRYTILDNDYIKKYNSLDNNSKVNTNIDIFIKMINSTDYEHAYEKLDNTFRSNNFGTVENFEEYIKNNFYKNNILTIDTIEQRENVYIAKVYLHSDSSSAAESKEKTFIVKLGEGTDFIMSFNIE